MCNRILLMCVLSTVLFSCRKELISVEEQRPTTPPPAIQYDESRILRVPGNYQSWNVPGAPKLVSEFGNGAYEGYINFGMPNSEFWLVKGTSWSNVTTYNQLSNSTFGFNGNYFTLGDGAGVYKVNANTQNFTWSATRINSWHFSGSAANGPDVEMTADATGLSWSVTKTLVPGTFIFRANQSNAIVFGHNVETPAGRPDYNGDAITISTQGKYKITLSLGSAGNYSYTISKL